jgi:hypothetical protein
MFTEFLKTGHYCYRKGLPCGKVAGYALFNTLHGGHKRDAFGSSGLLEQNVK